MTRTKSAPAEAAEPEAQVPDRSAKVKVHEGGTGAVLLKGVDSGSIEFVRCQGATVGVERQSADTLIRVAGLPPGMHVVTYRVIE